MSNSWFLDTFTAADGTPLRGTTSDNGWPITADSTSTTAWAQIWNNQLRLYPANSSVNVFTASGAGSISTGQYFKFTKVTVDSVNDNSLFGVRLRIDAVADYVQFSFNFGAKAVTISENLTGTGSHNIGSGTLSPSAGTVYECRLYPDNRWEVWQDGKSIASGSNSYTLSFQTPIPQIQFRISQGNNTYQAFYDNFQAGNLFGHPMVVSHPDE